MIFSPMRLVVLLSAAMTAVAALLLSSPPLATAATAGDDGSIIIARREDSPPPMVDDNNGNDDDRHHRPPRRQHRRRRAAGSAAGRDNGIDDDEDDDEKESGLRRRRRGDRETVLVDYAGRHPFDERRNNEMRRPHDDEDYGGGGGSGERSLQRTAYHADPSGYRPMRVQFDTHLLDALSSSHPSHVSYVRNVLLPSLRNFWSEAIRVVPASTIEVTLSGDGSRCASEIKETSGLNLDDLLQFSSEEDSSSYSSSSSSSSSSSRSIITNVGTDGNVRLDEYGSSLSYDGVDLVVIVIPVEGTAMCPEGEGGALPEYSGTMQTLAFATNCQHDQFDRPTVGYTGICFGPLDPTDRSIKTHKRRLLTIAHEFAHILGMSSYDFPYYYSHATGLPRTPRDEWGRPPEVEALCVDGTRRVVPVASESTLRSVTTANGYVAYEIVTETVRNVVRNQFDCRRVDGARLENQPTGVGDCFGSHWDHRFFDNEFMTSVYTGATQYVTALTLALLEDSGWYLPNYEVAQNSPFGLGAGCAFIEDRCIQDGEVPEWAEGTFCGSGKSIGCTPDKELVAYCNLATWNNNLPSGYQYFEDPTVGGGLQQMDFCPAYTTIFRMEVNGEYAVLDCTDSNLNDVWVDQGNEEVFSKSSRCIQHASGPRPLCLEIACGEYGEDAGKLVLIVGGEKRMTCSYAGEVLRLPSGTDVVCPSFAQACPESICTANCAGRGECNFSLSPPQCECFDRNDQSPFCASSPWSFAPTISPAPTQSLSPSATPTISPRPTELEISSGVGGGCYSYFPSGIVILLFSLFEITFNNKY